MQVTEDSLYAGWPSSDSAVAVVNDQSSYGFNTLPDFIQDLDSSNPGTLTRTIPGQMVWSEYMEHVNAVKRMNYVRWSSDIFCDWKNEWQTQEYETMRKVSLFNSNPPAFDKDYASEIDLGNGNYLYLAGVRDSPWPFIDQKPLSVDITQLSYNFGYGKLSAGHLDISKGKKSFGTLG